MSMSMPGEGGGGGAGGVEETPLNSTINTTPLVDIMLVLLIIFLITVPVAVGTVPVKLPIERNRVVETKPENLNVSVDADGNVYINQAKVSMEALALRLAKEAPKKPQPEVHIKGDAETQYENVGKVVEAAQRAGIAKVAFVTAKPVEAY